MDQSRLGQPGLQQQFAGAYYGPPSGMMAPQSQPMMGMSNSAGGPAAPQPQAFDQDRVVQLILDLANTEKREQALALLSKQRENVTDLAPLLWHSFGTMSILLQEIIAIYPVLSPPNLSATASNRVCNALALLQCVASHQDTRPQFLSAYIPLFLYPFLSTTSKSRPFEFLRLTSLGVIGALVKTDNDDVITFLLSTEIIPLCLKIMDTGTELSKTVATFIVQRILVEEIGLTYICATFERFSSIAQLLARMIQSLEKEKQPSVRLFKHIVRCYRRLADNPRAADALRKSLPTQLRDNTFDCFKGDVATSQQLAQLLAMTDPKVQGLAQPSGPASLGAVPR